MSKSHAVKIGVLLPLAMAVANVMAAAPVAPPASTTIPVIVTFKPNLAAKAPDLTDPRVLDKQRFGNLKPEVLAYIQDLERGHGFKADHGYSTALRGFSARVTPAQLSALRNSPAVELVEADAPIHVTAQTLPYGIANVGATVAPAVLAGDGLNNATAGLANVRAVVIDTGIAAQAELNVVSYTNLVGDGIDGDCHGHGTHVAGTIGARDDAAGVVGVAPGVALEAMKVLGCTGGGSASALIKAVDNTASLALANPSLKYVANMSVGFPTGTVLSSLDTSLRNAVASGAFFAVAAGNSGDNTCGTAMVDVSSGSVATGVMAVSAVDSAYAEASFSSYGACVATWAPGVSVISLSPTGALASMSGTSMATPHVAGAAVAVRAANPSYSPLQVDSLLKSTAKFPGTLSKDGRAVSHVNISGLIAVDSAPPPAPATSIATVNTPTIAFGTVKQKTTVAKQQVSITNSGTAALTITGLSGLPSRVTWSANTCSKVAPGASCALTLGLNTSKAGTFSAKVSTVGANTNGSFTVSGTVTR